MTERIVSRIDMTGAEVIDARLEHLLAGRPPAGDSLSGDISQLISKLIEAFPEPAIPEVLTDLHVAKVVEAATALKALPATPQRAAASRNASRARRGSFLSPLTARAAASVLAVTAAFSGMAFAGVLPDPLQQTVADFGRLVGIELPGADDVDQKRQGYEGHVPTTLEPDDGAGRANPDRDAFSSKDTAGSGRGGRSTNDADGASGKGGGVDSAGISVPDVGSQSDSLPDSGDVGAGPDSDGDPDSDLGGVQVPGLPSEPEVDPEAGDDLGPELDTGGATEPGGPGVDLDPGEDEDSDDDIGTGSGLESDSDGDSKLGEIGESEIEADSES